jgi:hypothetical protein
VRPQGTRKPRSPRQSLHLFAQGTSTQILEARPRSIHYSLIMQDTNDLSVVPLHRYSKDRHAMNTIELTSLSRDSLDKPSLGSSSSSSPSSPTASSSSSSPSPEDAEDAEDTEGLLYNARELEAQQQQPEPAPEHLTSTRKKIIFVALYFFLNLTLTLTNKSVLNHVSRTPAITTPENHH